MSVTNNLVNHPAHYTFGTLEVIDVLSDWFTFCPLLWQTGKYIARLGRKDPYLQDLQKSIWYLERYESEPYSKKALSTKPTISFEAVKADWSRCLDEFQILVLRCLQEYFKPVEERDPNFSALTVMKEKEAALVWAQGDHSPTLFD